MHNESTVSPYSTPRSTSHETPEFVPERPHRREPDRGVTGAAGGYSAVTHRARTMEAGQAMELLA